MWIQFLWSQRRKIFKYVGDNQHLVFKLNRVNRKKSEGICIWSHLRTSFLNRPLLLLQPSITNSWSSWQPNSYLFIIVSNELYSFVRELCVSKHNFKTKQYNFAAGKSFLFRQTCFYFITLGTNYKLKKILGSYSSKYIIWIWIPNIFT